jgi:hypothetical protein
MEVIETQCDWLHVSGLIIIFSSYLSFSFYLILVCQSKKNTTLDQACTLIPSLIRGTCFRILNPSHMFDHIF